MRVQYTPANGSGHTYEIESDRHGSYAVLLRGKVVKRVTALASYRGRPRWGSKELELGAIQDAKNAIELFKGELVSAPSQV
jgi:hypothetical protein